MAAIGNRAGSIIHGDNGWAMWTSAAHAATPARSATNSALADPRTSWLRSRPILLRARAANTATCNEIPKAPATQRPTISCPCHFANPAYTGTIATVTAVVAAMGRHVSPVA